MIGLVLLFASIYFYFIPSKRYLSIIMLFGLVSAVFQIVPLSLMLVPGVNKPYDWIFLFMGAVILIKPQCFLDLDVWKRHVIVFVFFIYLIFLFFYSVDFAGVEASIAVRVMRNFLFFSVIFLFAPLKREDYTKIFQVIIYFTTFASFLYCLQPIFGRAILNFLLSEQGKFITESGILRYYNYPVFGFPVIFFFFYKNHFGLKYPKILAGIVFMAILITQFRNMIAGLVACYMIYLYLNGKLKIGTIVVSAVAALSIYFIADTALDGRFSKGASDLSKGSFKTSRQAVHAITQDELRLMSTSEFRWYYTVERLYYLMEKKSRLYLGIGLANEDSRITNKLSFVVGAPKEEDYTNVYVTQIDTGDIVWPLLLLQVGLVGAVIFVLVYFDFFRRFYAFRKDPVMQIGIQYIAYLFIASFYITDLLSSYATMMTMLFMSYAHLLWKEGRKSETKILFSEQMIKPLNPELQ